MTVPTGDPIPFPVTNTPQIVCPPLGKGSSVLILNNDSNDNVFVGRSPGITPANSLQIAPGASTVWSAERVTYAFTDSTTPPITVLISPATSQYNLGPAQIVQTLDITALAVAIAEAIAQSGVPLLAKPTLLYSLPQGTTQGTLVGATIGANNYGQGTSQTSANNQFNTLTSRLMATTAQKIYYSVGQGSAVTTNAQASISQGCNIFASIRPAQTASNTYSDTTVTTTGQTCLQEKNNLTAIITNLLAAGLTVATLKVTLWQEPNNSTGFDTAGHYQNYLNYYLPAVRAFAGLKHVYNPLVGSGGNWNGFTGVPTNASWDELYVDYYGSAFNSHFGIDGTLPNDPGSYVALAQAHVPPAPFGVGEFNDVAGPGAGSSSYWANYMSYLQGVFTTIVANGTPPLGWLLFWMGDNAIGKPNNQILVNTDFKIPALQVFNDTFLAPPNVVSIAAGATVTLAPLNPVSNAAGGTAVANGVGYEVECGFVAGAGSTVPFCTVQMQWFATNNFNVPPIAQQFWSVPMGTNGTAGTIISGRGPQYGGFLRVLIHNLDSVACTISFQLNSNGRIIQRDDWLWDVGSSVSVPTFTLAGATAIAGNQVGVMSAASVPAAGSISRLFGLFSGSAFVRFFPTSGAGQLTFTLNPQPTTRWGTSAILHETPATEFEDIIYLPRGPCLVTVTNADGAAAHACDVEITAYD